MAFIYPYVRFLNRPLNNFVLEAMVNDFIKKDADKTYAFEVNFVSYPYPLSVGGAQIKVFKPNTETETLEFLGTVNAGTSLSPQDLDRGNTSQDTDTCTFEPYWQ